MTNELFEEHLRGLTGDPKYEDEIFYGEFTDELKALMRRQFEVKGSTGFMEIYDAREAHVTDTEGHGIRVENNADRGNIEDRYDWVEKDLSADLWSMVSGLEYISFKDPNDTAQRAAYFTPISSKPLLFWTPKGKQRILDLVGTGELVAGDDQKTPMVLGDVDLFLEHLLLSQRSRQEFWTWDHKGFLKVVHDYYIRTDLIEEPRGGYPKTRYREWHSLTRTLLHRLTGRPAKYLIEAYP